MSAGQQEAQGSGGGRLHPAAYRELQAGETYEPYVPAGAAVPEFTVRSVTLGIIMVIVFAVASTYSGLKIAQVMEAAIPISILAVGVSGSVRAQELDPRERHRAEHRRRVGPGRVRLDLHAACPVHHERGAGHPVDAPDGVRRLGAGVVPGPALPHPPAPLLRCRTARQAALPRGDGDQRGLRHGREGRRAGQDAGRGRVRRRGLRLPGRHRPGLERDDQLPVHPRGEEPGDDLQGDDQRQRDRDDRRPRLYHRTAVLGDHLRRRLLLGPGRRAAGLPLRPAHPGARDPAGAAAGVPDLHPRDERQPGVPPLRAAHRRRRDGRRRVHRHRPGAAHDRSRVLAGLQADLLAARVRRRRCRAPTATSR